MGKNEVLIQPAILSDASAILDLQKLAYQSEAAIYDDYAIPPLMQTPESMEFDLCMKTVLKATLDKKIIGSIRGFLAEGTCHIGRPIVDPVFQNRGIGTRLMQALEQHFASAERYELFTGDKSERNLYLYKKLGYKLIRTEKASDRVTHVFLEKRRPQ